MGKNKIKNPPSRTNNLEKCPKFFRCVSHSNRSHQFREVERYDPLKASPWLTTNCLVVVWSYNGLPHCSNYGWTSFEVHVTTICTRDPWPEFTTICSILWSRHPDLRLFFFLAPNLKCFLKKPKTSMHFCGGKNKNSLGAMDLFNDCNVHLRMAWFA